MVFRPRLDHVLEQQREHGHVVRLATAEAAMHEAPVLLSAIEHLTHLVEHGRKILSNRWCDYVVLNELAKLGRARSQFAELDNEPHRPDVLRTGQFVCIADRE